MSIMCHQDCKEGVPIPFVGYVCIGVSPLCSSFGVVSEAISIAPRGNVGSHSSVKKCIKSGKNTCHCEGCSQ